MTLQRLYAVSDSQFIMKSRGTQRSSVIIQGGQNNRLSGESGACRMQPRITSVICQSVDELLH